MALDRNNIPVAVYKQLVSDVHANLPTLHRYLKLRQRMMGVDTLRYEDLYAPIIKKVELRYTPEQATELTLKAVAPLGPDLPRALKEGLREPLDRLHAHEGKEVGRLQHRGLRRAPLPAAELHRALRGGLDAGARVGPLDAHLPLGPAPALRHPRVQDLRRRGRLDPEREPPADYMLEQRSERRRHASLFLLGEPPRRPPPDPLPPDPLRRVRNAGCTRWPNRASPSQATT